MAFDWNPFLLDSVATRMHSSRMRTARAFTICWSLLPRGCTCLVWGVYLPGPGGVYLHGPGGTSLVPGGVPAWSEGRGTCLVRGEYLPGPGGVPGQVLPPPRGRITHAYENITVRAVNMFCSVSVSCQYIECFFAFKAPLLTIPMNSSI